MKAHILSALLLSASASLALAQTSTQPNDPQEKVEQDAGANQGGTTTDPTAKPPAGNITDKASKDHPGTAESGSTEMPTAQPKSGSLSDKGKNPDARL